MHRRCAVQFNYVQSASKALIGTCCEAALNAAAACSGTGYFSFLKHFTPIHFWAASTIYTSITSLDSSHSYLDL